MMSVRNPDPVDCNPWLTEGCATLDVILSGTSFPLPATSRREGSHGLPARRQVDRGCDSRPRFNSAEAVVLRSFAARTSPVGECEAAQDDRGSRRTSGRALARFLDMARRAYSIRNGLIPSKAVAEGVEISGSGLAAQRVQLLGVLFGVVLGAVAELLDRLGDVPVALAVA